MYKPHFYEGISAYLIHFYEGTFFGRRLSLRNIMFLNDNKLEAHDVLWIEDDNVVGTAVRTLFHEQNPMHRLPPFHEWQILGLGFELLHETVGIIIVGPFALTYQYVLLVDGLSHDIQLHHPSIWSALGKYLGSVTDRMGGIWPFR